MSDETEVAWAAGFYDGEGSCTAGPGHILLAIVQTDREPLERFARAVGVGRINGPYTRKGFPDRKPQFTYQVASIAGVQSVFDILRPYLCTPKIEQLEQAFVNRFPSDRTSKHNRAKTHCPADHAYDEENTYWHNGIRYCRKCKRANKAKSRLVKTS